MSLFTELHLYGNVHVSVSPYGRLHVQGKYITVEFHPYCGPTFYRGDQIFEPSDEAQEDALWAAFDKWHQKFKKHHQKLEEQGKSNYRTIVHA